MIDRITSEDLSMEILKTEQAEELKARERIEEARKDILMVLTHENYISAAGIAHKNGIKIEGDLARKVAEGVMNLQGDVWGAKFSDSYAFARDYFISTGEIERARKAEARICFEVESEGPGIF